VKCLFIIAPAISVLVACSSTTKSVENRMDKRASQYEIVNLGSDFDKFWKAAQGKTFDEQLSIWNEKVERPHQAFYDGMVWQKTQNPKWEERKNRRLKEFFPKYRDLYPLMTAQFQQFNSILERQIAKFTQFFPDANFRLPIYAAPTATFNGKGGEGGDSGDPLGKTVLAFGIDMIVDRKDDPDVLYAHELFHIYHTDAIGVNESVFLNEGHLTLPLLLEGLATYISWKMNPSASLSAVLMDQDLPKLTDGEIGSLAKMFLAEANEKAFDPKKPEIYKKWFAIDPQYTLGQKLPHRCGYLLGLRVAWLLGKDHPLSEMVHWKLPDIHSKVLEAIRQISSTAAKNESKAVAAPGDTIPVNDNDLKILRRASAILNRSSKWNRNDDRDCPKEVRTFSLFCALHKASVEVNGEFDHRLGALEEVRRTVEAFSQGKSYEHRLMGYNNDHSTKFSDIKKVLRTTEQRVQSQLREAKAISNTIPFSYVEKTFMVVPVTINGSITQDFVFDTGIGVNVISKVLCKRLGCKIVGEHTGKRMSGQEVHIPMSSVESLSVGEHGIKNVPVGIFDIEAMMPGSKIGGFLSLGFFRDFPYTVDYAQQTLTFENPESLKKIRAEGVVASLAPDIQGPAYGVFMPLILPNGQKISVEVDTGSQALILNEKFMKELGVNPSDSNVRRKEGKDETGHSYARFFTSLKGQVSVPGSQEISTDNPEVMFQNIIYDGLVGHYFLSHFRVTYDLQRSEIIFRAPMKGPK